MNNTKIIKEVYFELCSVPDSEGLVLELSNNEKPAFLEVRVDSDNTQWFRFFSSKEHIAVSLEDMEKAIKIAKKEVINTSIKM